MDDKKITISKLKEQVKKFVDEREWNQFHDPKNLAAAITVEAGELLEKFIWVDSKCAFDELEACRQEVEDELADVIIVCLAFANATNIDISSAISSKIKEIKKKYPTRLCKGKSDKYTSYKKMKDK